MITISNSLAIPEDELSFEFMRSSGPGGQNVNKVASAVRLKFDVENSSALTAELKKRLYNIAGNKIDKKGILSITARGTRTQNQNRQAAIERFKSLLMKAEKKPKRHIKTSIPVRSKLNRLEDKKNRSRLKLLRHASPLDED